MTTLKNKTAILTGASGGIGLAVVKGYLDGGAYCIASDIGQSTEQINDLCEQYSGQCEYVQANVCDAEHRAALIERARTNRNSVDILFNNAAVFDMAPLLKSDEAMYQKIFDVNVKGMFFLMQGVAQSMVDTKTAGAIVNLASQAGRRGESLVSHYCASKAAVISYTQSAALALAEYKIRVNAISPGVIDTPMWKTVDGLFAKYENLPLGRKKQMVGEAVPLGYMGAPEDICGAAVFLASDNASYITGQTLNVDGGNVLS
ncbi:MAG: L-iditol 2-dehydrogenase [Pseudomonadota bacterium]